MSIVPMNAEEDRFLRALDSVGFKIFAIERDGNCLFRAVSHQLFGDQSAHRIIRQRCCDYIEQEKEFFSQYCWDESLGQRLQKMRQEGTWGDNLEIQAISELYECRVEIYYLNNYPVMIYSSKKEDGKPLRLYYRNLCHYDSIIDTETVRSAEDSFSLMRKRSLTDNAQSIPVISRQTSGNYMKSSVDQIVMRSMGTLKADADRQTHVALKESIDNATEEAILRMELAESARKAPQHGDIPLMTPVVSSHQLIDTKDFGIYKFALGLGYSMEMAMAAHFKLEKSGVKIDPGVVLDFLDSHAAPSPRDFYRFN